MKSNFDRIYDDSARIVMMVVSGKAGIEMQIYNRDEDTANQIFSFLASDENIIQFMQSRANGDAGVLYLVGCTMADLLHNKETGEALPGIKVG